MHNELTSIKRNGTFVIGIAFLLTGTWLALAPITKTVTATGMLRVSDYKKTIRHPYTATVKAIHTRDGAHIQRGQPLLSLDNSEQLANFNNLSAEVFAERIRITRLQKELSGEATLTFGEELNHTASAKSGLSKLIEQETILFNSRKALLGSQKQAIQESIKAIAAEINALNQQVQAIQQSRKIAESDLVNYQKLQEENFFSVAKVNDQRRIVNDYVSRQQEINADIAQAKQRMTQSRLQLAEVQDNFVTNTATELKEANKRLSALLEQNRPANQLLKETVITSPVSGTVMSLKVHTVGSAIGALDTLLEIVPDSPQMSIDARLGINAIRHVRLNQQAEIRFPALPIKTTPLIFGTITYIASDATIDPNTGEAYYAIKLAPRLNIQDRDIQLSLKPGMLAEIYIQTNTSTPLDYLLEPLRDAVPRTFQES